MAFATVILTNGLSTKKAPIGFSWTTFFWSGFPALFRGDWGRAALIFIASLFTSGIAPLIIAFFYNKHYLNSLFARGWYVQSISGTTETGLCHHLGTLSYPKAP